MLTPFHLILDVLVYLGIIKSFNLEFSFFGLLLLFSADLIDLDHLFSNPIYTSRRNPFKKHFIHKNWWKLILIVAIISVFYHEIIFLCVGLVNHFLLDFIEVKIKKIN
jgi:hypothetical protein